MALAEIIASSQAIGQRLDRFVCDHEPALSRAAVRRMIESGLVEVNGRRGAAGQRLQAGDRVALPARGISSAAVADPCVALELAYEDESLVVANKPAGMATHPLAPGEGGTLASGLLARYPEMLGVGYSPREPGLVHRLDVDTSGLVLAARDRESFVALRALLEAHALDKRYLALCSGGGPKLGLHAAFLSARGAKVVVRSRAFAHAEPIATEVLACETLGAFALVELRVAHARRHQIRAHLAALGHPIAGDARYGGPALAGLARQFLHASELHFTHPRTGRPISIYAPLPAELVAARVRARDSTGPSDG